MSWVFVNLAFLLELGLKAMCIGLAHIRIFGSVEPGLDQHRGLPTKAQDWGAGREAEPQSAQDGLNGQFPSSVLTT